MHRCHRLQASIFYQIKPTPNINSLYIVSRRSLNNNRDKQQGLVLIRLLIRIN